MAYDIVRWGIVIVIFIALSIILSIVLKKKGKAILIASFAAIIAFAILLLVPVENFFYSFPSVEKIFSYRYHEKLLTYAECNEGVLCVGQKDDYNFVYYTFGKSDKGYKLQKFNGDDITYRSSKFGVYIFKKFESQIIIITQAADSLYDGKAFKECESGYYYYTVIDGDFSYSHLTCSGERVTLV